MAERLSRSRLPPERAMCEKRDEIDERRVRYRRLGQAINDQQTTNAANRLIAALEAEKRALHTDA